MAEPFMAEIRMFSCNFAPQGWAQCNGQLLPINQNQALFSLLGTMYGGNGQTNFALPDLRSRVPMHIGNGHTQGERGGEENHTLISQEMPQHQHTPQASADVGTSLVPGNTVVLARRVSEPYHPPTNLAPMAAGSTGNIGGSQAHSNQQPYLVINFCIALQGIFPSQN